MLDGVDCIHQTPRAASLTFGVVGGVYKHVDNYSSGRYLRSFVRELNSIRYLLDGPVCDSGSTCLVRILQNPQPATRANYDVREEGWQQLPRQWRVHCARVQRIDGDR